MGLLPPERSDFSGFSLLSVRAVADKLIALDNPGGGAAVAPENASKGTTQPMGKHDRSRITAQGHPVLGKKIMSNILVSLGGDTHITRSHKCANTGLSRSSDNALGTPSHANSRSVSVLDVPFHRMLFYPTS